MTINSFMRLVTMASMMVGASAAHAEDFGVLGIKVGSAVGGAGFACTQAEAGKERECVRFTDTRCSGKASGIGALRYGENPPMGCFLDPSTHATYLDGKLQQTSNTGDSTDKRPVLKPLDNIHVIGTLTNKVFQIYYMTEKDDLAADSKLYKALKAKFGEPTDKNPPDSAKWRNNGAELKASCGRINCEIFIIDRKLREMENQAYEAGAAKARRQSAPDPKL